MMRSLDDIMRLADSYMEHLSSRGVPSDAAGFPLLSRDSFLDEWPVAVVPYKYRGCPLVRDKARTLLCHFAPDDQIYPRLDKVFDELGECRGYLGVTAADLTVTADMDPEWQAMLMLVNQLYMAVLAVSGIKVVANARCGSQDTERHLHVVPAGVMWATGFLGCDRIEAEGDASFAAKIAGLRPSRLVIYGKRDRVAEDQLARLGIRFRRYPDVHARYKVRRQELRASPPA